MWQISTGFALGGISIGELYLTSGGRWERSPFMYL
jgi:hypothetical protein